MTINKREAIGAKKALSVFPSQNQSLLGTLTMKDILDVIRKNFPEIRVTKHKIITTGHDNYIVIVNDEIIFRIPKENENVKADLKTEMDLLDFLGKHITLSLPQYTYRNKDGSFGGYPIIKGKMLKKPILRKIDEAIREEVTKDMAKFLEELHVQNIEQFAALGFKKNGHHWFSDEYQSYMKQRINEKYGEVFQKETIEKIYKFLDELKRLDMKYLSFTHFDLNPKNVIYDENARKLSGVIDFADACIFDPAIDFAKLLQHFGPTFTKQVVKHYTLDRGDIYDRAVFYRKTNFIFGLRYYYKEYANRLDELEKKVLTMLK